MIFIDKIIDSVYQCLKIIFLCWQLPEDCNNINNIEKKVFTYWVKNEANIFISDQLVIIKSQCYCHNKLIFNDFQF
ncbi:MAG: hypothetical protein DRR16_00180 [Candidatus Parabeggiatoa sp. nov. 3]|nr:MAG: hypothetical protein DRR00_00510 [Gammaproteobacteria bacterium]RKZ65468.1 MAG: hypothetical protein DRQ99_12565 [Gammaproteobacteria bacterium]RKZ90211.1 MAG: hypothetical protein DRR16_00180 [Gammaproteobacteria bacterium]